MLTNDQLESENSEQVHQKILCEALENELLGFEEFLKRIGFKRIHGSIYGLLVMAEDPLSSSQIEKELGLSQSAVSQAIKVLTMYSAIQSQYSQEDGQKNTLLHSATTNTLDVVASVFRKREAETISNYKQMAQRIQEILLKEGRSPNSKSIKRIQSVITTSQLGEIVIDFILMLADMQLNEKLNKITDKLPQLFQLMASGTNGKKEIFGQLTGQMKNSFFQKIKPEPLKSRFKSKIESQN